MIELMNFSKFILFVNVSFILLIFIILVELVIYLFLKIWRD